LAMIIVLNGLTYDVEASWATRRVDDSYDGHLGGERHTFRESHLEINWDTFTVESCVREDGSEIDADSVPGLRAAIEWAYESADLS